MLLGACLRRVASMRIPFLKASWSFFLSLFCGGVLPGVRVSLVDRCRRFLLCRTVSSCVVLHQLLSGQVRPGAPPTVSCLYDCGEPGTPPLLTDGSGWPGGRDAGAGMVDGGRHTDFECGRRHRGREGAQNVNSRIVLGGGLWCRVHVMIGFEVSFGYQRERGPAGPLTQPLHDILTAVGRRGCNRRASWPPSLY